MINGFTHKTPCVVSKLFYKGESPQHRNAENSKGSSCLN